MSVIVALVVVLIVGFAAVGLVGILGWRARMRTEVPDLSHISKAA